MADTSDPRVLAATSQVSKTAAPSATIGELKRLDVDKVYVVGGPAVITINVLAQLR